VSESTLAGIPAYPYFADYFQIVPSQPGQVWFRAPRRSFTLRTPLTPALLSGLAIELNGKRPAGEILDWLGQQGLNRLAALSLLQTLNQQGALLAGPPAQPGYHLQTLYFGQVFNRPGEDEQTRLAGATVLVFGLGGLGSHLLASLARAGVGHLIGVDAGRLDETDLQGSAYPAQAAGTARLAAAQALVNSLNPLVEFSGLELAGLSENIKPALAKLGQIEPGQLNKMAVAALDQPHPDFYEALNRECLDLELAWTLAQFDGFVGLLGPTVVPFYSPCYHCYRLRSQATHPNRLAQQAFEDSLNLPEAGRYRPGQMAQFNPLLAHSLSLEITKLLTGYGCNETADRLLSFDFFNLKIEAHPVLRVPDCPVCGRLAGRYVPPTDYAELAGVAGYA
jgi:bacteriocin biosynthesis cyclodehydratase domain-containing protein